MSLIPPPSPPTQPVMLEVAYPHPDGLLSQCPDGLDVVLLSGSVSPHPVPPVLVRAHA
jgi:hypothetical protein